MGSRKIRERFLQYFRDRDHTVVSSSSLIPDDPSVLLTTAGMQQFKPYFVGDLDPVKDFGSKNTVSIQKSFRTSDIDEVGDEDHLTFFEMLGNFSFGGYFKEKAIEYAYDFVTKEMELEIDFVSVFDPADVPEGDWRKDVPFDEESYSIWKDKIGIPEKKIRREGIDNFWGPTGSDGPCGPTTEIYVNGVEIWNIVFNEFYCPPTKKLEKLKTPGVDTGMGLERLVMAIQKVPTIFETYLFKPLINLLPDDLSERDKRIVADHARGIAFLISDGVRPSNKEAGYILRRLMRRVITKNIDPVPLFSQVVKDYGDFYPELDEKTIISEFQNERDKFGSALQEGLKKLKKEVGEKSVFSDENLAKISFNLHQSYGLPIDVAIEEFEKKGINFNVLGVRKYFDKEFEFHQEVSRAGLEKKFGGHGLLLDTGELKAKDKEEYDQVLRLHTATHLLQQALRDVLGESVRQAGSDVTSKRTRFDFTYEKKLTEEELKKVEDIVNQKIKEDLPVKLVELPKEEAEKTGALHFFKAKYPAVVKVYYVGESLENAWSKEFCGGPHVDRTGVIGKFKITKEESVAAGVRRIRAVVI